jgi:hypothetical protein
MTPSPAATRTIQMRILGMLAASMLLVGCVLDGPTDAPRVSNRTGSPIEVQWTEPGLPALASVASGQTYLFTAYPTTYLPGNLVAKDPQGREVARTEKPLCPTDDWIIEGSPAPPD